MRRSLTTRKAPLSHSNDHFVINLLRTAQRDSLQSIISTAFRTSTPAFPPDIRPNRLFLTDTPSPSNLLPALQHLQKHAQTTLPQKPEVKYTTLISDLEATRKEMNGSFKDLSSLKHYVKEVRRSFDSGKKRSRRLIRRIFKGEDMTEVRRKLQKSPFY